MIAHPFSRQNSAARRRVITPLSIEVGGGNPPFTAARAFVRAVLSDDDENMLPLPLRFVQHSASPPSAGLTDRQRFKTQLRFYTRVRCVRELRAVAWLLADRHPMGFEVRHRDPLNAADRDFFDLLGRHVPLVLTCDRHLDAVAGSDPEDDRAVQARKLVARGLTSDTDWEFLREELGSYLSCGDSWTAMWLAEAVLRDLDEIPAGVAEAMALSFVLQGRTADADMLLRLVDDTDRLTRARSSYSLAMLYARHHPKAIRDLARTATDSLCCCTARSGTPTRSRS